jgi:glutaredoxin 3
LFVFVLLIIPSFVTSTISLSDCKISVVDSGSVESSFLTYGNIEPFYQQIIISPINSDVTEINKIQIDTDPALRAEMMEKTGRRTVPQIYIGEKHIGGFDDLRALDLAGELDPLLVRE